MTFDAGFSAVKTGFELAKGLLDVLKREGVEPHEVSNRLMEIQELFLTAQKSLMGAQDENRILRDRLDEQNRINEIEADLEFTTDGHFYVRKSESARALIPYCPVCWGSDRKLIPMAPATRPGTFKCAKQDVVYQTEVYREWLKQEEARVKSIPPFRGDWP